MHKKVQALVLAGMISANTATTFANTLPETSIKTKTNTEIDSAVKPEKNQIYLSDIEYESGSNVGWGEIRKDTNVEGNGAIKLIVEGETVEFGKGMGAHANSTLIYNVSEYSDTYTRLVSYIGVDASRGSNGNGVRFIISTSTDGQNWTEVKRSEILKGDTESEYIDIDLSGVNYIKLHANSNGGNASDHAVYGDLKLVKTDYTPSSTEVVGLEIVGTYDSILNSESIEENITNNELTILRRAFVKRLGYGTLKRIADQEQKYSKALNYLLNSVDALKYFTTGGPVSIHGSYLQSFKCFSDIYDKYESQLKDGADDNFNLRLAISIALSHGYIALPTSWLDRKRSANAVERYEVYQELIRSGRMDAGGTTVSSTNNYKWSSAQFKALPVAMMRWTVDNRMNNDEIVWLADYALKEKEAGRNHFDAYNYIEYRSGYNYDNSIYYDEAKHQEYNDKYGFDEYYSDYGNTNMNRMWMVFEEGSVCGGLAQTYSNLADTFGRPSSPCGQPGHAASLTYAWNSSTNRYEWIIQNNISGWTQTGNQYDERMLGWGNQSWTIWHSASYTVLATDAVLDQSNYEKAAILNLLADSYTDNDMKKSCYEEALEYQAINLDSMEGLINCYIADENTTEDAYFELANKIIETYNYYPQTMMELLALIEDNITDASKAAQLDMLKYDALVRASNCTATESTNVMMTQQLANKYLGNESMELATFSFDGENAGDIVINEKYNGSSIRVRYSLDGGTTWKETDQHVIELTDEELASITAENDVQVGLVGTSNVYTIDILTGRTISSATIYANDNENLLIGSESDLANLEFSTDGGNTWCNYIGGLEDGIRIEGNKTVKVRYKAYEQYLQSAEVEYTFTEDTDTDERKYIQLKNVSLVECSAANGNTHKGEHLIDGSINTGFHTPFRQTTENKFYTVEFDKVRNITSIEYFSNNGYNGKLKSGEIYTSLDGENWTLSGTFTDLERNHTLKTLDLDAPTATKFIKIVATETHGNSDGERNMYLTGQMLNFYEDTTIVEEEQPPVDGDDATTPPTEDEEQTPEVPEEPETPEEDVVQDIEVEKEPSADDKAYVLKVNTKQGLDKVLEWLDSNMSYDREENAVVDPDTNTTTYKINVFHNDGTVSYVDIKVSSDDNELVEMLEQINVVLPPEEETPEEETPEVPEVPEQPPVEEETPSVPDTPEQPEEQPPVEDDTVTPPTEDEEGDTEQPPVEEEKPEEQPPVEEETPEQPPVEDDQPEETPEEQPGFTHDVLELVSGDGQENNPYEFIVKAVEIEKFNSFLDELKEWTLAFISVTKEGEYTSYNLKLDKKLRSANDTIYITLKVKDDQTEIVSALNELGKELHPSIETDKFEEVLDGTANDDMMVAPEIETPSVDGGVTPDKDDTTNNSNTNNGITSDTVTNGNTSNNTDNSVTNNPTTGDVGTVGYIGLGLASVIGLFKNRRKRK